MHKDITAILSRVAMDVVEKLAFLFAFAEEKPPGFDTEGGIGARVTFSGPYSGMISMVLSPDVLDELTINMLGVDDDEEVSESQRQDALGEALNVVCGNVLPAIAGCEVEFALQAPGLLKPDEVLIPDGAPPTVAETYLSIDEGFCLLVMCIDGPVEPVCVEDQ